MKIGLIGFGKMGKAIERIAGGLGHTISQSIDDPEKLDSLLTNPPEVVIEFTVPSAAPQNIRFCLENNLPVISGTTGWNEVYDEMVQLCRDRNGTMLHASNFSIGVNLFFELNRWLASKMSRLDFNVNIEEVHHTEKKDSPSGTAISLAEGIVSENEKLTGWEADPTDQSKIRIISRRLPNVPGTHTVSYESAMETIDIKHEAHNRDVFAQGVLLVAEWIKDKKGVYSMGDFMNDLFVNK